MLCQNSAFLTQPLVLLLIIVGLVVVGPFLRICGRERKVETNEVEMNAHTNELEGGVVAGGSVQPLFGGRMNRRIQRIVRPNRSQRV